MEPVIVEPVIVEPAIAVEAHDLYRFFHASEDETLALRGVSLTVGFGEFVAITGPSGSGKSTLLSCLGGLDEPDGGWVAVGGERLTRRSERERSRLRARLVGTLQQTGNLLEQFTVAGNIALAMALRGRPSQAVIRDLLESVGLSGRRDALPSQLSGGERARAGLAVALANEPVVLLADEPTGEVDAATEARLLDLFVQRGERGGATVVVTHSPSVAAAASRVVRMTDGRFVDG